MQPQEILILIGSTVFVLVVPGWVILNLIGSGHSTFRARIVVILGLGLVFLLFAGIALSELYVINSISLYVVYGILTLVLASILWKRRTEWSSCFKRLPSTATIARQTLVVGGPYIIGLLLWYPYLGLHASDLGLHAFWGKWIVSTQHLPNYNVAGPSLPSELFVFGPHLLLATVSLISGIPVTDIMAIVLYFFYSLILLTIQAITLELTRSELASTFASLFYVTSQIPAARVLLGNLPDVMGYFLLATLVLVLLGRVVKALAISAALIGPSIVGYYQYALITEVVMLAFAGILVLKPFVRSPQRTMLSRNRGSALIPAAILVCEAAMLIPQTFYLSLSSLHVLQMTHYPILQFSDYVSNLGNSELLYAGAVGVAILLIAYLTDLKQYRYGSLIAVWVFALFAVSLGPRLGIGVEPIRFVWHLVEPLSIAAGILAGLVVGVFCGSRSRIISLPGFTTRIECHSDRARRIAFAAFVIVLSVGLIIIPTFRPWPNNQVPAQPYYADDIAIGLWLKANAPQRSGIAVDSDIDSSSTWIQAYALRPRFFYKVDYAATVSAPQFATIYRDMATLFDRPYSPNATTITAEYNISYVVAHGPKVAQFSASPFFGLKYQTGDAAVYSPQYYVSYAFAYTQGGYLVTTSSGRQAAIMRDIQIQFRISRSLLLNIPVHDQIVVPSAPAPAFKVSLDGLDVGNYTCPTTPSTDSNLGLQELFPTLKYPNVSGPVSVNLTLQPGTHEVEILSTSSVLFEIYLDDLASSNIAFDTQALTVVAP